MKRIIIVISLSVLLLSAAGCSSARPEDTVYQFFEALKAFDLETMLTFIEPSNDDDIDEAEDFISHTEDETSEFLYNYLVTNAGKITFAISDTTAEGDKAVVTVDIRYIDSGEVFLAAVGEMIETVFAQALSGVEIAEDEIAEMLFALMEEKLQESEDAFMDVTIDINLVKIEGTWYLAELNDDLLNVMTSGFLYAAEALVADF